MPTTPRMALPYPALTEPANIPLDMQELAEKIEAEAAGFLSGTAANRPAAAAAYARYVYWSYDTGALSACVDTVGDGTGWAWREIAQPGRTFLATSGTEAVPGISFVGDEDTGVAREGADQVSLVTGGARALRVSNVDATPQVRVASGSALRPGLTFDGDPDSGWFRTTATGRWHFAADGVLSAYLDATLARFYGTLAVGGAISWTQALSSGNVLMDLMQGYALYSDNTGPGTAASRLWLNTPDGGAIYLGPRAGGSLLDWVELRSRVTRLIGALQETRVNHGTIAAGGTLTADSKAGTLHIASIGGNSTVALTLGTEQSMYVRLWMSPVYAITWPTGLYWQGGVAPTLEAGHNVFSFWNESGALWGSYAGRFG